MPSARLRTSALTGIVIIGLTLSACSDDSSGGADEAAADGELSVRVVLPEPPNSLDPCDSNQFANGPILLGNVTESLTFLDVTTGELEPNLATGWEALDDQTWRFELEEGVTFHDGQPFDAEAVASWMTRILDPATGCYLLGGILTENVLGAEVVDEYTVDIKVEQPDPILPTSLAFVSIGAPTDTPTEKTEAPVGTGPYVFDNYSPGQQLQLSRWDSYRGEVPDLAGVTYVFREESSVRAAMASTGEVDIATSIGSQDSEMAGAITYTVGETLYFRIDATMPPLDDVRVRQALTHAIDRETYVNNVLGGNGEPANELFISTTLGYNENIVLDYDPGRSRALLAEAAADGVDIEAPFAVFGEANLRGTNGAESLETISAMLNDVGLNTHVTVVESAASVERRTNPIDPSYDPVILQNAHGNSTGDGLVSYTSKVACEATQAPICIEEFDAMMSAASVASGDERDDLVQEIAAYHYEEVLARLPIAHLTDTIVIANERIQYTPNSATSEQLLLSDITIK